MSLPILTSRTEPSSAELVRYFHKAQRLWTEHVSPEFEQLDIGTAFFNASLPRVASAGALLDVALPAGVAPEDAARVADAFFSDHAARCRRWVMNPSAPSSQTEPMARHLLSSGHLARTTEILHLSHVATRIAEVGGLTIIPARASFRHARGLAEQASSDPQSVEAAMAHLDDPHWEALLALSDGKPAAAVGVLAAGEIGLIAELFVSEPFRRRGIGRTMMSRALEICARSLFKHVLLGAAPDDHAARALFAKLGFQNIGEYVEYLRE